MPGEFCNSFRGDIHQGKDSAVGASGSVLCDKLIFRSRSHCSVNEELDGFGHAYFAAYFLDDAVDYNLVAHLGQRVVEVLG